LTAPAAAAAAAAAAVCPQMEDFVRGMLQWWNFATAMSVQSNPKKGVGVCQRHGARMKHCIQEGVQLLSEQLREELLVKSI
jgi:hypothetical protein